MSDYIKRRGYKHEAPRGAEYRCENGVMSSSGMFHSPEVINCGKEATVIWIFNDDGSDPLLTCEEHDSEIIENVKHLDNWCEMRGEL